MINETRAQKKLRLKSELSILKEDRKADKVFVDIKPLSTLSTWLWYYDDMPKNWKERRITAEDLIHRIIRANSRSFQYLGIASRYVDIKGKPALEIVTDKYAGAVPFLSPSSGNTIANIEIVGRFGENVGELISLLDGKDGTKIIEYREKDVLCRNSYLTPPFYLECIKYIDRYIECEKTPWQVFSSVTRIESHPASSTDWVDYALKLTQGPSSYKDFRNKRNILSREHEELWMANYVLNIAISEIESYRTPSKIQIQYHDKLQRLKHRMGTSKMIPTSLIPINSRDNSIVRALKEQANTILGIGNRTGVAWRIDYTKLFECFTQYIFNLVAKDKGASFYRNPHYGVNGRNMPSWSLNYIEPDLILQYGNTQVVIDAKYKSHVLNWNKGSDDLKDTFRHDLHQILAYCSFNPMQSKQAMLVYPFSEFVCHRMKISSPLNSSDAVVHLVGIPLEKSKIEEITKKLNDILHFGQ